MIFGPPRSPPWMPKISKRKCKMGLNVKFLKNPKKPAAGGIFLIFCSKTSENPSNFTRFPQHLVSGDMEKFRLRHILCKMFESYRTTGTDSRI